MPSKSQKLHPVDPSLLPFQVGERVAFTEDHKQHGGLYGQIEEIGLDEAGALKFDVTVIDPATSEPHGKTKTTYRAGMEDIQ